MPMPTFSVQAQDQLFKKKINYLFGCTSLSCGMRSLRSLLQHWGSLVAAFELLVACGMQFLDQGSNLWDWELGSCSHWITREVLRTCSLWITREVPRISSDSTGGLLLSCWHAYSRGNILSLTSWWDVPLLLLSPASHRILPLRNLWALGAWTHVLLPFAVLSLTSHLMIHTRLYWIPTLQVTELALQNS